MIVPVLLGSIPGVFVYQLIGFPLALSFLVLGSVALAIAKPDGDAALMVVVLGTLAIVAIASLAGFWAGWRVGWGLASGSSVREIIPRVAIAGPILIWLSHKVGWPEPPLHRAPPVRH